MFLKVTYDILILNLILSNLVMSGNIVKGTRFFKDEYDLKGHDRSIIFDLMTP